MNSPKFVKSLAVHGFRGIQSDLRVDFGRRLTILSGGNAAGKSSVVQAIQFAMTGQVTDQYDRPIANAYLQNLRATVAGEVTLEFRNEVDEPAGTLTASTSDSRGEIRRRATELLVREWNGPSEPPFTVTHLTSQELLGRVLSPDSKLNKHNIASLCTGSYLRLMVRRAELLTDHCRRMAVGDNARKTLLQLTERLETSKALRDGIASSLSAGSMTRESLQHRLGQLASQFDLPPTSSIDLKQLGDAVLLSEATARAKLADIRIAGSLLSDLAAADAELLVARRTRSTLEDDKKLHEDAVSNLSGQMAQQTELQVSLRVRLENATAAIDQSAAYDLWKARRESLSGSLTAAQETVEKLSTALNTGQKELASTAAQLDGQQRVQNDLSSGRQSARAQLEAIEFCRTLPQRKLTEDVAKLTEQFDTVHTQAGQAERDVQRILEELTVLERTERAAVPTLSASSALFVRMSAAIDALTELATGTSCPLCGHDHGSTERLTEAIADLRTKHQAQYHRIETTAQASQQALDLARQKLNAARDTFAVVSRDAAGLDATLDAARRQLALLVERRREALERVQLSADSSDAELAERESAVRSAQDGFDREITDASTRHRQLESINLDQSSRVTALQAQVDQARRLQRQMEESVAEQDQRRPESVDPQTVVGAQRDAENLRSELRQVEGQLATLAAVRAERQKLHQNIDFKFAGIQESIQLLERRIAEAKRQIAARGVSEPTTASAASAEATASAELTRTTKQLEEFNTLRSQLAAMHVADRLRDADMAVAVTSQELELHQRRLKRYEEYHGQFEALYADLVRRQNSLAEALLSTTAEPCRRLFHAMTAGSPWPLVFRLEDERIVAKLGTAADAPPAASVLNAAYFNVAAVALRLALAGHQTWSFLRSTVLDDPILEMDHLTQAALIDGLESILTSHEAPWNDLQIVLATWSEEFALMAAHKLAHLNESTQDNFVVYQLEPDPSGSPTSRKFAPHWTRKSTAA